VSPPAASPPAVSPPDRVAQAVQQLQRRHRVPVGIVGVRGDRPAGERQVRRVRHDPDVEPPPVVRLAHVPERRRDLEHHAVRRGHAAQQREPVPRDRLEDPRAGFVVAPVLGPVRRGQPAAFQVGRAPEPLGVLGARVGLGLLRGARRQPVMPEGGAVAVRGERHLDPGGGAGGGGHDGLVRDIGDCHQPLTRHRVATVGARTVVP
jgi:hypothetical protein